MFWRIASFLLCLSSGGVLGWALGHEAGAAAGLAGGSLLWFGIDLARATQVVNWLRRGAPAGATPGSGVWGQVADRVRRVLRARDAQAAEAGQRLQEFLSAIQASPNGVVLLDADGRIEWCNHTAAQHFGFDPDRDLQQLIGNLVRDPAFSSYYAGGNYSHEVTLQGAGTSSLRPVRIAVHLHPYGEGRKLMLSRDVTAVEQADTMRRDFVANVSHEIRTPLTVLAGFVETLQSIDLPQDERQRYLQMMAQQAQRMQSLVNDLLTLSRLEGSPPPGAAEWSAVGSLLAQCEYDARSLAKAMGKRLEITFAPPPAVEVSGSPTELLSALSNLVSNAVRYTPSGGEVVVAARRLDDGRLELAVRDTGPGIAPEHIPRLTERFYRVDRSRSRETGGTGLGLAIVKHVVQRHGAELRIDSAVGAGSTFAIVFPAARLRPSANFAQPAATEPAAG
ncbi:phosphate regulon sensor histidine kinase PhoR [Ramlibacter albus]|uniref:Phosphate regulon sensor protein PhoR n=1 Tax=Ramlibacter albus TaxID=2079448 RepID=A0A923M981_9BURK|nr:phosphate regulon sensor histidine kinase PhoR [Ramlibacter albus]MBC5766617.1 phosphate regulon sensor histidine kinase PhoR [Ramlibacter albus]